jgi:hypothetical protein
MRRQSLRALANLSSAPVSPAVASVGPHWSRQESWGRRCCNNLNRHLGRMLFWKPSDGLRIMEVTCGA